MRKKWMMSPAPILLSVALLAACGGGGEGASTASGRTFALAAAYRAFVANGYSLNFTLGGTCSGTAKHVTGAPMSATFNGTAVLATLSIQTVQISSCTMSTPIASTAGTTLTEFFSTDYRPLGYKDFAGEVGVYRTPPNFPELVSVGDSGPWGVEDTYTDDTRSVLVSRAVRNYTIAPGATADTAVLDLKADVSDAAGNPASTQDTRFSISADSTLRLISAHLTYTDGSELILTAK